MIAPMPHNEQARLEALKAYSILDTEPEHPLDLLAAEIAALLNAPIAVIGFIDEERHWFKAKFGTDVSANRRVWATCAHTIYQAKPLIAPDTRLEPRFADMPPLEQAGIRAYAGAPIITADGCAIGTVCVFDRRVRGFSEVEIQHLENSAKKVLEFLEARLRTAESGGVDLVSQALTQSQPSLGVEQRLFEQIRLRQKPRPEARLERLSHDRVRIVMTQSKPQNQDWQLWVMNVTDTAPRPMQRFETAVFESKIQLQAKVLMISLEPKETVSNQPSRVVAVLPVDHMAN